MSTLNAVHPFLFTFHMRNAHDHSLYSSLCCCFLFYVVSASLFANSYTPVWQYTDIINSYVHQPDAEYMLALIRTVYCHQTDALRDTLWKYMSFKTSIRVNIPVSFASHYSSEIEGQEANSTQAIRQVRTGIPSSISHVEERHKF